MWINVEDRMPEERGKYICYIESFEDGDYCQGWFDHIEICLFGKIIKETIYEDNKIIQILSTGMDFEINSKGYKSHKVTHWMPLPNNPEVN